MDINCSNCKFSELVVKEGELYSFINPYGDEVERPYTRTVFICRESPPLSGDWPQVSKDDWCGKFSGEKQ